MTRLASLLVTVALGAAATLVLASCGGSNAKLLPGETAREITANLDTVRQLADEGDCIGAESAAQQVSEQIEALGGVDAKLQSALREGATRLNEVVSKCEETAVEAAPPVTVPAEPESKPEKPKKEHDEKKPEDEEEAEAPESETEPTLPPQANGEAKGHENGNGPPVEEEVSPSGGVSPSAPSGEEG
ncbi:MAG: hypothetical protein WBM00_01245 [Solirubrobacterales bacterium]